MIGRFQYYVDKNLVRVGAPDKAEARSLMAKAASRLSYIEGQKMDEGNAEFIFEGAYEAMREAGQALMAIKGYKPYSHEALVSFMREFFSFASSDMAAFDRYRVLRNKAVYSATRVSAVTCRESLDFLKAFLPKIEHEFKKLV